jgi:hypothetical protein
MLLLVNVVEGVPVLLAAVRLSSSMLIPQQSTKLALQPGATCMATSRKWGV